MSVAVVRQLHGLCAKVLGRHPAQCNCMSSSTALLCQLSVSPSPSPSLSLSPRRIGNRSLSSSAAAAASSSSSSYRSFHSSSAGFASSSSSPSSSSSSQETELQNKSKTDSVSASTSTATTTATKVGMKDKFKLLWKQYGVIAVGTYFSIYFGTLGGMYLALDHNVFSSATFGLDPAYAIDAFCHIYERFTGDNTLPSYIREHPAVGTFGIAYIMTKFSEPLRLGVTIGVVPTVARWLGRRKADHDHEEASKKTM